ncbi:hypothetical protein PR048_013135 [Dryococelus australis]|uniref:InsA N-terminal domain-containing protein n=1 Tax=Dryococelus australis TaxID=614101 RepID=A0ABQ9HRB4_9NEOP|nr:hypothetical protein PR048_013135 [Dryococelus australis]
MSIVLSTNNGKSVNRKHFMCATCYRIFGKVCDQENRYGYIRTTLLSRSAMPKFGQKSDLKSLLIV